MELIVVKTDQIIYKDELYPRFAIDNDAVSRYMANLDALPPILISTENFLIDGKHRLRAHQLAKRDEITVEILDIAEGEVLKEAIRRNSTHGKQLDNEEKKDLAQRLYDDNIAELIELLAVDQTTIYRWTENQRADRKEQEHAEILNLYLQCWTQDAIAKRFGIDQATVVRVLGKIRKCEKCITPPDSLKLYDVWNFAKLDKSYGQDYPGRIPGQIVENVLWYFTDVFNIVCDPMAGGGTIVDVCDAMYRRCLAYDLNSVHDRVKHHDIQDGFPEDGRKVDLVFLDPPYFKKKSKEYDLQPQMETKKGFMKFAETWVSFCDEALKRGGKVALLMSDYVDYDDPKGSIFSHEYVDLFNGYNLIYKMSVPLGTQQYTPFHVDRAKENKAMLIIGRELYILQKV